MPLVIRVKRSVWEKVQEIWDRAQYLKQEGLATQGELEYLRRVIWDLDSAQIFQLYHFLVAFTDQLKAYRAGKLDVIIWPGLLKKNERGEYEIKLDL